MYAIVPDHQDMYRPKTDREKEESNRRQCERRQQECRGCAYIPTVGWMDRRRKTRREEDELIC